MRNGYTILDAHCHIYPARIAVKAVESTDEFYLTRSACRGVVEDMIDTCGAAGTDAFVVQSVASIPHHVGSINRFIAGAVAEGQGKLIGLGTLHPDSPDLAADLAALRALGLHGVKLHPDMQKFAIDDKKCYPMYELCEQAGLPMLIHMGDPRYDFSSPDHLLPVLRDFPDLVVVGAHMGGWMAWDDACDKLSGFANLYVDTCSSLAAEGKRHGIEPEVVYLDAEHAARLIRAWGADKVLYGTDYPMWSPEAEIAAFFALGLTETENRAILSENALRVFGNK